MGIKRGGGRLSGFPVGLVRCRLDAMLEACSWRLGRTCGVWREGGEGYDGSAIALMLQDEHTAIVNTSSTA